MLQLFLFPWFQKHAWTNHKQQTRARGERERQRQTDFVLNLKVVITVCTRKLKSRKNILKEMNWLIVKGVWLCVWKEHAQPIWAYWTVALHCFFFNITIPWPLSPKEGAPSTSFSPPGAFSFSSPWWPCVLAGSPQKSKSLHWILWCLSLGTPVRFLMDRLPRLGVEHCERNWLFPSFLCSTRMWAMTHSID